MLPIEFLKYPDEELPPAYVDFLANKTGPVFSWLGEKTRRFSRLAGQGCLLGLDAVFFAGKMWSGVPAILTKTALTLLSGVGFISMPYTLDFMVKSCKDAIFGYRGGNYTVMLIAAAKVAELVSTVGLIVSSFAASVEGMRNETSIQDSLYKMMTPLGEATLALGIGLTVVYMYMNHRALKILEAGDLTDHRSLIDSLTGQSDADASAAVIRLSMDKDTLEHLLQLSKGLPQGDLNAKEELVKILEKNIKTQQVINLGGQCVLFIIGDILLAVEKWYTPNSLVSASINLGMASIYTAKILVENLREVDQRHQISMVIVDANSDQFAQQSDPESL